MLHGKAGLDATQRWLWVAVADPDQVLVTVVGGTAASRADELWAALEEALEMAEGRLVVADLTRVTAFDLGTIDALIHAARAATRRHDDLCFVMGPNSPLGQYARNYGLDKLRSVYSTVLSAAVGYSGLPAGAAA